MISELRSKVPQHTLDSLDLYVQKHIPTGGFLQAVLENDLKMAFARADHINQLAMFDIVNYLYNEVPSSCWGSRAKVGAWLAARGAS